MGRKKKIFCISVAGVAICASVVYGYTKKQAEAKVVTVKKEPEKLRDIENVGDTIVASDQISSPDNYAIKADNSVNAAISEPLNEEKTSQNSYPLHKNISTTYFWAGEEAGEDNKNISNLPSAWDDDWVKHFGGVDNPKKRNGLMVASFAPKENSFYFALPYNDFDEKGNRKKDVGKIIPWANSKKWGVAESMCKNQWIKVTKGGKTAYAQWEDVGPFGEDDSAYVFGGAKPKSKTNETAGLDVSPAVKDYLSLGDIDKTDWQFVDAKDVPDGPWKQKVTSSQISWN